MDLNKYPLLPYHIVQHIINNGDREEKKDLIQSLFVKLMVDQTQQKYECKKLRQQGKALYTKDTANVLVGTLYENDIAWSLIYKGLRPIFNNTRGHYVNLVDYDRMKVFDIVVRSVKDNTLYGFDVKFGTIWRKHTNNNNIYITNTGITDYKLREIYNDFKQDLRQRETNNNNHSYIILVCYDLLEQYQYENYNKIYQNIFGKIPHSIYDVSFVVDVDALFKTVIDEQSFYTTTGELSDNTRDILDKSYLLNLHTASNDIENHYYHADGSTTYSILVNSPVCYTLDDFINKYLL